MEDVVLKYIPIFSGLDRVTLASLIPELERLHFSAGEILFHKDDYGDSLYIILEGEARVFVGEHELAYLGPGECVGEMALLTGEPRNASVQAKTALTVLRLSRERFEKLAEKHHSLAVHINHLLSERLKFANERLHGSPSGDTSPRLLTKSLDGPGKVDGAQLGIRIRKATYSAGTRVALFGLTLAASFLAGGLLLRSGLSTAHVTLCELFLVATFFWMFNLLSFRSVAVGLPVAAVLLGVADPAVAFSGFSSPSWFLLLAVFALTAAISKTGLLYRAVLHIIRRFPPTYIGQAVAVAVSGLLLTPVIPSSYGRVALAGPLAGNLTETLGLKSFSAGSAGVAMACLLGFGHMSFMFLNGGAESLLVLGLLPAGVEAQVTWSYWLKAALPLGLIFFGLSCLAIIFFYHTGEDIPFRPQVIDAQLKTLGPLTRQEVVSLVAISVTLAGFFTQHWHHVNGAWIAMVGFLILLASSVLDDRSVMNDINWNFLISFGAVVGFGAVIAGSGLTTLASHHIGGIVAALSSNKALFLVALSLAVHLLRFVLPPPSTIIVSMLTILPVAPLTGIDPFVIGLVILVSVNPWFIPSQSSLLSNLYHGMEERAFTHEQTLKMANFHLVIVMATIAVCVPYWMRLGLIS